VFIVPRKPSPRDDAIEHAMRAKPPLSVSAAVNMPLAGMNTPRARAAVNHRQPPQGYLRDVASLFLELSPNPLVFDPWNTR
jgi:hypothetical protein